MATEPWALELLLEPHVMPGVPAESSPAFDDDEALLLPELPTWAAGARSLRCLETAHGAECTRCVARCRSREVLHPLRLTRPPAAARRRQAQPTRQSGGS